MAFRTILLLASLSVSLSAFQASGTSPVPPNAWPPERPAGPTSPALSPDEALTTFSVPPGYHVELVAAEPLVDSPIVIDFDPDGRLWIIEAPAFLPDLSGRDSPDPINRVVVLEDVDDDGRMDRRTVFADGLVMPRALKVLHAGVLVGEPPNLWLMKDIDGDLKADTKELVAEGFGRAEGNIEHNANGLLWAMDNIMYTSEHSWNLRLRNGRFETLPTLSRGQWQISQDDAGRVFRNVNDSPLYVDYTPAQYFLRNPNVVRTRGAFEMLIEQMDATIYPVRPTRGVNRGYRDEYFRRDGSSIVIQGAGTPTIYRGDRYPESVRGDAFITDSPTNLVHQMDIVDDGTGRLSAKNTWPQGEFFASSDERFRPVNLFSAPDGTMYVVDMYRGVVQAGGYWSDYLTEYIRGRELLLPVARGRIWRVVYGDGPERRGPKPALSAATPAQLVETLSHPNGWWRDTAQRLLVERGDDLRALHAVGAALTDVAANAPDWRTRLQALWTLDGRDEIVPLAVNRALSDESPHVRAAAIRIAEPRLSDGTNPYLRLARPLRDDESWTVRRQWAASIGALYPSSRIDVATRMLARDGNDPIIVDAVLSGLNGLESDVLERVLQNQAARHGEAIAMLAAAITKAGEASGVERLVAIAADTSRPAASRLAILRGIDAGLPAGRGGRRGVSLPGLSPPGGRVVMTPGRGLTLSAEPQSLTRLAAGTDEIADLARQVVAKLNWTGKPAQAAPSVPPLTLEEQERFEYGRTVFENMCATCHGLEGEGRLPFGPSLATSRYVAANAQVPIRIVVGGKDGNIGLMPPIGRSMSDEDAAAVLTYIRRSWGHTAAAVGDIEVREVRQSTSTHLRPWTEEELSGMVSGRGRGGQ